MKKMLKSEELTATHRTIMQAVQSSMVSAPSHLTARGPLTLLNQILPNEMKQDGAAEYMPAITGLIHSRWLLVVNQDPFSGLARYRLSHDADIYLRQLVHS
jgi:hypothetical protein